MKIRASGGKGSSAPSTWYVQTSGGYYPNGSNDILPVGAYSLSSASASTCSPPCSTPDCIQEIIARIVKEQGEFYDLDSDKKYFANKYAFEMLAKDTSLMYLSSANDSIIKVFYEAYKNNNIDLMAKIKDYIANNDSISALSINSSITPENLSEENEKLLNKIYLETWGKYIFEFDSTQTAALEEIAYQNPISGGASVYGARTMLNIDISDNFGEVSLRQRGSDIALPENKYLKGKVVPNPTTGEFKFVFDSPISSKGILEVYDLVGNLVKRQLIYKDQEEVKMNMSANVSGMYLIKIIVGESILGYEKIIIQK